MKIAVAGTGYVGLSLATLLSQKHEVVALDIVQEKVDMINKRISPIKDREIEDFFKDKQLNLRATLDYKDAFKGANFVVISTPTNYDDVTNHFDTSSVEDIIQKVKSMIRAFLRREDFAMAIWAWLFGTGYGRIILV